MKATLQALALGAALLVTGATTGSDNTGTAQCERFHDN